MVTQRFPFGNLRRGTGDGGRGKDGGEEKNSGMRCRSYKDKKRNKQRHWILYLTGSPIKNVGDKRRG